MLQRVADEKNGNRRGRRSREEILDVASRVMAERGYAATSLSVLSRETGLPKSAVYHHFQSKAGLLSAVMARGAYEFFAAMRDAQAGGPEGDTPRERLTWFLLRTGEVFAARPDFLRLHLILIMSAEAAEAEVDAIIEQVRHDGRVHMNKMIAASFAGEGAEIAQAVADELEYFGIAGFDGAFVATQADPGRGLAPQMTLLAEAMAALGEARVAALRGQ
ncbi:helix-turn-helix transcriptional regulator [Actinomadura bangladeshensis]|uniref:Helix-turn-helix transcriptional regulator n=1 Tax=Actinomadura bangladeshensis TaxID=453573 RepID=A0A6L9QNM5_9ACTN|nr:TetR/AcrR family transcriptional regulator [Actinomadura bangladeshensis]NEA27091.1 helix-turn-helix transcriptional regulator [Actinomadura bangladeshensis]